MNTTGKLQKVWINDLAFSAVFEMDQKHFPRSWSRTDWLDLSAAHHELYIWEKERPLGFALFMRVTGDETAHLLKVCLLPEVRGGSESAPFWKEVLVKLNSLGVQKIYLEVEAHNQKAIGFYQKCGFEKLKLTKAYYSDGSDAWMMSLTL